MTAVAIVGIGCRFPGGIRGPAELWEFLTRGGDAITEAPPGRLDLDALYDPDPGRPGKLYARWGGFVDGIDLFDADFFGISPREARRIDPQQRLLLEVMWEALEDGGQPPDGLGGSDTGVFVGISGHDYAELQSQPAYRELIDVHVSPGSATSIAANRVSYLLDLRGPSLTVDTACSSALTAVHLACVSLARAECGVAIVGAVNALITAEPTIGFCKAGMLSPKGCCKPFDARADGYVRSEGAGAVVLKPLDRALADDDPIYAVIRGTGVNQDGRTQGISVPNPAAQEALLRQVLREAGTRPDEVGYIEAHGTGTPVGDPREAHALGAVMAGRPAGRPCLIGSVKGNLGHLEAAAGMVGLIKAALTVQRRQIVPTINFEQPNPAIAFDELRLRVPTMLEPWPGPSDAPAVAGVNAFGFGGANAHAILEEPPPRPAAPAEVDEPHLLALSARSAGALSDLAAAWVEHLREDALAVGDLTATAAVRRSHHEHRIAAVGRTKPQLAAQLATFVAGQERGVAVGRAREEQPRVAFVFSGMGPQWWGMGRDLLRDEPVYADTIHECDRLLRPLAGWSLLEELTTDEQRSRVAEPYLAPVANLVIQVALAALWRSWGIAPDAVVGHSSGEMAAACVAGALTLPDALRLAFHRGRLQHRTASSGGMLAAGISPDTALEVFDGYEQRVSLAAVNGPTSVTFSGALDALGEIAAVLERRGCFHRMLPVTVPYHGPQMDALRDEFLAALVDLPPGAAATPMVSTVTGEWQDGQPLDAGYWWRNMRRPVHFATAVDRLVTDGCEVFVELSPHPVLTPSVQECLEASARDGVVVPSLRRGADDRAVMLGSLGGLYVRGRRISWPAVFGRGGRCVPLPRYPWQRERHWAPEPPAPLSPGEDSGHPLLGRRLRAARPTWEADLGDPRLDYLDGHRIEGSVTFPGAGHVELALAAARAVGGDGAVALEDVAFRRLLPLVERDAVALQCLVQQAGSTIEIHSARRSEPDEWTLRATAGIVARTPEEPKPVDVVAVRERCPTALHADAFYRTLDERHGLGYEGAFHSVTELWTGDGEAWGAIVLPDEAGVADRYRVHPALLDAAFQVLGAVAVGTLDQQGGALVPVAIARVELHAALGPRGLCHAHISRRDGATVEGAVTLHDEAGRVAMQCTGLRLQLLDQHDVESLDDWLYEERWEAAPRPADVAIPPAGQLAGTLAPYLDARAAGHRFAEYYSTVEPALNALTTGFVHDALRELGFAAVRDGGLGGDALADRLGVVPRQRRFFARLLELATSSQQAATAVPDDLDVAYPAYRSAIALVRASGRRLAGTLRGIEDAREWLVAGEHLRELQELYTDSPLFDVYLATVAETVAAVQAAAGSRPLRILEVGAGTGSATGLIIDRLPPGFGEYLFTDLSPFFLRSARERFADRPELRTEVLDIEQPPVDDDAFDVVVAADVVHATTDVRASVRHLRARLAPGGLLVLVEVVRRSAWADLVFGQLEGWWRATDLDVRPEHPLLGVEGWTCALQESGFAEVVSVIDEEARAGGVPAQAVLLATGPAAAPAGPQAARQWLVLTDRRGVGPEVAAALHARGDGCTLVWPGAEYRRFGADGIALSPSDPADWAALLRDVDGVDGVIALWALDAPDEPSGSAALMEFQETSCGWLVGLTDALASAGRTLPDEVWVVTAGAQAAEQGVARARGLAQAPVWGLGRVLRTEQGSGRCRLVDLSADCTAEDVAALLAELDVPVPAREEELALRDGRRLARRLRAASLGAAPRDPEETALSPEVAGLSLAIARPGSLNTLGLRETAVMQPGPGEVAVRVVAAALNFRDVLVALGVGFAAAGQDPADAPLGWECTGVVVACGDGVVNVAVGDEVIAIAAGAIGSRVLTLADRVAPKPPGLTFEEATTLPVAFLTAGWALERLARLEAGERVLIHCASGGVGLAAVQIARRAGAQIFATAGTPEKRAYLRSLGIEHVMDSRTLDFADEVRALTDGEGVDVVLNALAGEAIDRSLELLRPYGRFVEIGKRDIYEGGRLGLAPFRRNLAYFAVDLQPLYDTQPALIGRLLHAIVADVASGALQPLRHHTFDLAAAEDAFRLMAQARHIGKVVLTAREPQYRVAPRARPSLASADAAYVVTGGLGGFGLAVAAWLAREGAGHIVLVSRSGVPREEDAEALDALIASPAHVEVVRGNVADPQDIARVLDHVRRQIAPLRGVIHAAMVLDDALLGKLDYGRFEPVVAPKLAGAWNLHQLTADDELDLFVLFSSISAVIGQPAQASYAAANEFLGALAAHRRARGQPALTVDWGAISGVGYVARHPDLERRMQRQGLKGIPPDDACAALGELLRRRVTRMVVSSVDWSARATQLGQDRDAGTAAGATAIVAGTGRAAEALRVRLAGATAAERPAAVERYLRDVIARVLETTPERIDVERRLPDLGVDSLMAVELRTALRAELGVEVPIVNLLEQLSVRGLAETVAERLDGHGPAN
jgi:acyl transferase domain-containing protein/NADPH:quinone reductase-like Zn-dependent oxidoreductase/acyl carrier protein